MNRDPATGRFARTPEQQHAELVGALTRRSKPLPPGIGPRQPPLVGRVDGFDPSGRLRPTHPRRYEPWELQLLGR
jgi:hypothetical protein